MAMLYSLPDRYQKLPYVQGVHLFRAIILGIQPLVFGDVRESEVVFWEAGAKGDKPQQKRAGMKCCLLVLGLYFKKFGKFIYIIYKTYDVHLEL